jgi:hypothetical protein
MAMLLSIEFSKKTLACINLRKLTVKGDQASIVSDFLRAKSGRIGALEILLDEGPSRSLLI